MYGPGWGAVLNIDGAVVNIDGAVVDIEGTAAIVAGAVINITRRCSPLRELLLAPAEGFGRGRGFLYYFGPHFCNFW